MIAVDYQMLTSGAFQALASFATEFSGNGVDMDSDDYDAIPHVTGYTDSDYDELIESAYNESDLAKRAEILHQAEEKLMNGEYVLPDEYYFKGTVDFRTGDERYKWLERKICVCTSEIVNWERVDTTVYLV